MRKKILTDQHKRNIPFKFNYGGDVQIGYKIPDFVCNPQKIVIEVANKKAKSIPNRKYGSWQNYTKERISHFSKYNYRCLVLWEEELNNPIQLLNKVNKFRRKN